MRDMQPARFAPAASWRRFTVIDAHTEGEPLRIIVDGVDTIPGATMLAKRRWAQAHLDDVRRTLMLEPRGHADMYGCIVTPPVAADSHFGVLFLHNEGWSTMCGHGIIGIVTVALETGMLPAAAADDAIGIDTPAGRVVARAERDASGRVRRVAFVNVPSFVALRDTEVEVPGHGTLRFDLAFGGAFYAFVDPEQHGLVLEPDRLGALITAGRAIKAAVAAAVPVVHPEDDDLGFLYGTILVGPGTAADSHSRHVCIFADGEVDRSPTGTGVSARLALLHARGELATQRAIEIESILGTRFGGRIVARGRVGPHDAVIPEVSGRAWITGRSELVLAPDDPLERGFLLRA